MKARESKPRVVVSSPDDAARVVRPVMHHEQETFVVVCVDVRNQLINKPIMIALGTVCGVEVHPRDVFRAAIAHNAAGIIIAHNHPSGDVTPSSEDVALTKRLVQVGEIIGIPVIDHVIVNTTCGGFRSLADMGAM